jgi:hypothetical protein
MQVRAILEAAVECQSKGIKVIPEIMIPLVMDRKELKILTDRTNEVAQQVIRESKVKVHYLVGTMIEIPRAALLADEIAEVAEFFSFGTNDLTQMGMGLSRDDAGRFLPEYVDEKKAAIFSDDPFQSLDVHGVGMLIRNRTGTFGAAQAGSRNLRRARRRRGQREVLPRSRHGLRQRVTVPRANCTPSGGTSGDRRARGEEIQRKEKRPEVSARKRRELSRSRAILSAGSTGCMVGMRMKRFSRVGSPTWILRAKSRKQFCEIQLRKLEDGIDIKAALEASFPDLLSTESQITIHDSHVGIFKKK